MDGVTAHVPMSTPERISGFDPGLADRLRSLINGEGAVLVEFAGRDSIAACLSAARSGAYRLLVPTVSYTGTELGDWTDSRPERSLPITRPPRKR